MKKTVRVFMLATLLLCFTAIAQTALAQGPPPPPSGDGAKGSSTNKAPGGTSGSPIGNGTFILVALAAAYAGRKAYLVKNEKK
jgi:Spy/CpxP family protein refolding chaperone